MPHTIDILTDLTAFGLIKISGLNAKKFLQGQLTCNLEEINPTQSRLGAHCDAKGRIQLTARVFNYKDDYYLRLPRDVIAHALICLNKYAVFSKITLTDVSDAWQQIGISSIHLAALLEKEIPEAVDEVTFDDQGVIIRVPGATPRFEVYGSMDAIKQRIALLSPHLTTVDFNTWELLDIEADIPWIYSSTIGEFTPHQISYQLVNGVSFNKGCYTGQEIVARMHYLGKLKQRLYQIRFTALTKPLPGAKVYDATHEIGILINAACVSENTYLGLACLQDSAANAQITFEVVDNPH